MKFKHKYLIEGGPADGPQLPNVFHYNGTKEIDGVTYIGLTHGNGPANPTWYSEATVADLFVQIGE